MPESWTAGVGSRITDTCRIKWGKILLRYGGTLQPTDTIRIIKAKILSLLSGGSSPVTPAVSLNTGSAASDVIVSWTQTTAPDTNQVWRSDNGGAFALIATVSGAATNYHDTAGMAPGDIRCWKVRGLVGALPSSFSNIVCATNVYSFPQTGAVSEPTWVLAFNGLAADNTFGPTSLTLAGLLKADANLELGGLSNLTAMSLPALTEIGADFYIDSDGSVSGMFTTLTLPALTTIGGNLFGDSTSLVTVALPVLVDLGGDLDLHDSAALSGFSAPVLDYLDGHTYNFSGCALSAVSVAAILAAAKVSLLDHGLNTATIQLDGGTSAGLASLSAQAQLDYAILVADGNTVTINP